MPQDIFQNAIRKAANKQLSIAELFSIAADLMQSGRNNNVSHLYKIWIESNQDNHSIHAAYFNYGVVLTYLGDLNGAKDALYASAKVTAVRLAVVPTVLQVTPASAERCTA